MHACTSQSPKALVCAVLRGWRAWLHLLLDCKMLTGLESKKGQGLDARLCMRPDQDSDQQLKQSSAHHFDLRS